jgi:hypothetical protein
VLPLVNLTSGPPLQSSTSAGCTQNVAAHPISSYNLSALKEGRAAQREGVTSPGPILSTSSMKLATRTRTQLTPLPSQDVQPSRASQGTGINTPLFLSLCSSGSGSRKSPFRQVDSSHERDTIRPHAQQIRRIASVQPSAPMESSQPPRLPSRVA